MALVLRCYLQTQTVYFINWSTWYLWRFYEDKSLFDFRDYPKDLQFMILLIKKWLVRWKMKLEERLLMSLLDKSQRFILRHDR